jgi:hypothetical protein
MVVTPPFAHFHHDPTGWQSLFAVTGSHPKKSVQNADHRDIPATVCPKANEI